MASHVPYLTESAGTGSEQRTALTSAQRDRSTGKPWWYSWPLMLSGLCALVLGVLGAMTEYVRVVRYGLPLGWDEAEHAVDSLIVADDLRHGQWLRFFADSSAQHAYPPGMSWLQAPTFLLWQPDDISARYVSLLGLVTLASATWALGVLLAPRMTWLAGLMATSLLIASPLPLDLAGQSMNEILIANVLVVALCVHTRWRESGRDYWAVLAGLAVFASWMTKYNYASFLLIAVIAEHAWSGDLAPSRFGRMFRLFYQPLAAGMAVWLAFDLSTKVQAIIGFGINQAANTRPSFWQTITFYPHVWLGGTWLAWSQAALTLGGVIAAVVLVRAPRPRLVWLFLAVSWLLLTVHPNKQDRYLMPILPVLWALAAAGLSAGVWMAQQRLRWPRAGALLPTLMVALGLMLGSLTLAWLPTVRQTDIARRDVIHAAFETIAANARADQPLLFVGTFADFGPHYVPWGLRTTWKRDGSTVETDYAALSYPGTLTGSDTDPSPNPAYATRWAEWRQKHPTYWLATLKLDQGSPFWGGDYGSWNAWKLNYVEAIAASEPPPVATMENRQFAITIRVYAPRQPAR